MCLYPKFIRNPRYKATKKNNGIIPFCDDIRKLYIPIGCGNCIECRKQKANNWRTRLQVEIKSDVQKAYFVTLTFNEENLNKLSLKTNSIKPNIIAAESVKLFRERWRKKYKKSIKHFFITELGEENDRIHLHGIIWTNEDKENIKKIWSYGIVYIGDYCNTKSINYIVKYIMKIDKKHKGYNPIILTSKGIGKNYIIKNKKCRNKYNGKETIETMKLDNGTITNLPIYYRNNIWTEEERDNLWTYKLDKKTIYVLGEPIKIDTPQGIKNYNNALKKAQKKKYRIISIA